MIRLNAQNKNIKGLLIAVLGLSLSLSAQTASAQGFGHGQGRLQKMQEKLGLSDDQLEQIRDIKQSVRSEARCRDFESDEEFEECRTGVQSEVQDKIKAVLTEDQQAEFEILLEKRRQRKGKGGFGRGRGHRGRHRMEFLQQQLDLNEEQTEKIKQLVESVRAEYACGDYETREEHHACRKEAHQEIHQGMESILSEEQLNKLSELRSQREERFGNRWSGKE